MVGPVGQYGADVRLGFARGISGLEQGLVPIRFQVKMESTALERALSRWTAWVSVFLGVWFGINYFMPD